MNLRFLSVTTLISESGCTVELSEHLKTFKATSVFLVTDAGIDKLGLAEPAITSLTSTGLRVTVDTQVTADPSEEQILKIADHAKRVDSDLIIGFGGGSSMDAAKLVALLALSLIHI